MHAQCQHLQRKNGDNVEDHPLFSTVFIHAKKCQLGLRPTGESHNTGAEQPNDSAKPFYEVVSAFVLFTSLA